MVEVPILLLHKQSFRMIYVFYFLGNRIFQPGRGGGGGGGEGNDLKWHKCLFAQRFFHFLHRNLCHFMTFYAILDIKIQYN